MNKVLIVSGGGIQGQALITLFRSLNTFEIHVFDIGADTIGRYLGDGYLQAPPIADSEVFVTTLLNYISANQINFLVPSTVFELETLSELKDKSDLVVLVSLKEAVKLFMNKMSTQLFLEKNNLPVLPRVLEFNTKEGRLIAKDVKGFGGKGISIITSQSEFEKYQSSGFLIQPYLKDFEEISVDQFFGPHGMSEPLLRKRIKTTGGYAVISEITNNTLIADALRLLLPLMVESGAFGFYNIQFLISCEGEIYINDINPRIGTSAAFVHGRVGDIQRCLLGAVEEADQNLLSSDTKEGDRVLRIIQDHLIVSKDLSLVSSIAFDLDDTLIDHKAWCRQQAYSFINKLELGSHLKEEMQLTCDIIIEEHHVNQLIDILVEKFKSSLPGKEALLEVYRSCRPNKVVVYSDVEITIRELKRRGYYLCILTNNPVKTQKEKIALLPFGDLFDEVYYSQSIQKSKPDKECFQMLEKDGKHKLQNFAYVGDNPIRDVYGAINAGCAHSFLLKRDGVFLNASTDSLSGRVSDKRYTTVKTLHEMLWYL